MQSLEEHFEYFRKNTIGHDLTYKSPYGIQKLIYADWIASGRLYKPIEDQLSYTIGPFVANTHTETSETGTLMTKAYHHAHKSIKKHVNAGPQDVIITAGTGMTTVVNKMQRIMGFKSCRKIKNNDCLQHHEKPVVFISHMEHHSNHTSWFETNVDVVVLQPDNNLLVDPQELRRQLEKYKDRSFKIGSFTACSNVTGIETPYHELAKIMHEYGGIIFVDFAASAPYVDIDMHPADDEMKNLMPSFLVRTNSWVVRAAQGFSFSTNRSTTVQHLIIREAERLIGPIPGANINTLMTLKCVKTEALRALCKPYAPPLPSRSKIKCNLP